jgi:hypothetical protein
MCGCKQYACHIVHLFTFVGYTDMKANLPAPYHDGLGLISGKVMWYLWWAMWHWGTLFL